MNEKKIILFSIYFADCFFIWFPSRYTSFSFNWAERYNFWNGNNNKGSRARKKTKKELEEKHNERTNLMREHKKISKLTENKQKDI